MWSYWRGVSTLVTCIAILLMSTAMCVASTCSEAALRTFTSKGKQAAFEHFSELLEDKHCRDEPAFWVNFAQLYKARSSDPANSCRAHRAYAEGLKSNELQQAYVRVAKKGQLQTWVDCQRFRQQVALEAPKLSALLHNASTFVRQNALFMALREYELLMEIVPDDIRPIRGFCKTARVTSSKAMLAICKARINEFESRKLMRGSEISGTEITAWAFAGTALVFAGIATWSGIERFTAFNRVVDAHHETELALALGDNERFSNAQSRELKAGKETQSAQQLLLLYGSLSAATALTAFSIWYFDDEPAITLSTQGHVRFYVTF